MGYLSGGTSHKSPVYGSSSADSGLGVWVVVDEINIWHQRHNIILEVILVLVADHRYLKPKHRPHLDVKQPSLDWFKGEIYRKTWFLALNMGCAVNFLPNQSNEATFFRSHGNTDMRREAPENQDVLLG